MDAAFRLCADAHIGPSRIGSGSGNASCKSPAARARPASVCSDRCAPRASPQLESGAPARSTRHAVHHSAHRPTQLDPARAGRHKPARAPASVRLVGDSKLTSGALWSLCRVLRLPAGLHDPVPFRVHSVVYGPGGDFTGCPVSLRRRTFPLRQLKTIEPHRVQTPRKQHRYPGPRCAIGGEAHYLARHHRRKILRAMLTPIEHPVS